MPGKLGALLTLDINLMLTLFVISDVVGTIAPGFTTGGVIFLFSCSIWVRILLICSIGKSSSASKVGISG